MDSHRTDFWKFLFLVLGLGLVYCWTNRAIPMRLNKKTPNSQCGEFYWHENSSIELAICLEIVSPIQCHFYRNCRQDSSAAIAVATGRNIGRRRRRRKTINQMKLNVENTLEKYESHMSISNKLWSAQYIEHTKFFSRYPNHLISLRSNLWHRIIQTASIHGNP